LTVEVPSVTAAGQGAVGEGSKVGTATGELAPQGSPSPTVDGPGLVGGRLLSCLMFVTVMACAPGIDDALLLGPHAGWFARLPSLVTWGMNDAAMAPKLCIWALLGPVVMLVALREWNRCGALGRFSGAWLRLVVAYAALLLVSQVGSLEPLAGVERVLAEITALGALAGFALVGGRRWVDAMLLGLAGAGVANSLYSLCQHLALDPLAWSPSDLVRERSIGTLANPDFLASYLVCTWPLCLVLAARARSQAARVAWYIAGAVAGCALAYTYTRGAYLAALAQVVTVAWFLGRSRWGGAQAIRRSVIAALLTALSMALFGLVLPRSATYSLAKRVHETVQPHDASTLVRLVLWKEAALVWRDHPWLGTGPGTFNQAMRPYRSVEPASLHDRQAVPNDPHNLWLCTAAESGSLVVVLLLTSVLLALARGLRSHEHLGQALGEHDVQEERLWITAALLGWVVAHGAVQATFADWLMLWPLCLSLVRLEERAPRHRCALAPVRASALVVGLLVVLCSACQAVLLVRSEVAWCAARTLGVTSLRVGGEQGAQLLRSACDLYDVAATSAPLWRRGGARAHKGHLLEAVAERLAWSPPPAAGAEDPCAGLARQVVELYQQALVGRESDPYLHADVARASRLLASRYTEGPERQQWSSVSYAHSVRSVELDPYNTALVADHARRCVGWGRKSEAIACFRQACAGSSRSALDAELAALFASQGDLVRARQSLESALGKAVEAQERAQLRRKLERVGRVPSR
jgi:O-antigen ligase